MVLWTIVDVDALWRTAWTAAVAGVGISVVFGLTVLGATRYLDMRREDRPGLAAVYVLLAALGTAGTLASVVYGVVLITTK
ncbi:MAG: hypothetical protein JWN65_1357 [Solirubrobacterales bacterium]|nr:hypothetical protein [Solirubrobacterales bacterium]